MTKEERDSEYDDQSTVSGLSVPTALEGVPEEEEEPSSEEENEVRSARPAFEISKSNNKEEIIAVNTNLNLHDLFEDRQWDQALALLKSEDRSGVAKAEEVVSIPFRGCGGDYPLHVVCDWDYEPDNGQTEGNAIDLKNAGKGKGSDAQSRRRKALNKPGIIATPPPFDLIKVILEAYPKAARTRGRDGSLPLH